MRLKGLERLKENSGVEAKRHPVVPGRLRETRNELMNVVIGLFWKIQDGGTASGSVEEIAAAQPAEQAASFTPLVDLDPRIGNVEGKEMEKPKYI